MIGGYGMYGVILDVTLQVTRDELLRAARRRRWTTRSSRRTSPSSVKADTGRGAHAGAPVDRSRPGHVPPGDGGGDVAPRPAGTTGQLPRSPRRRNVLAATGSSSASPAVRLGQEPSVVRCRSASSSAPGESRVISRNNAMRPPLAPLELLRLPLGDATPTSSRSTTCRSQHFVPFMDQFREILLDREDERDELDGALRDPERHAGAGLRAGRGRVRHHPDEQRGARRPRAGERRRTSPGSWWMRPSSNGGTYYLTYQLYPTPAQLNRAYPRAAEAFERKRFYDPDEDLLQPVLRAVWHARAAVTRRRARRAGPAGPGGERAAPRCGWRRWLFWYEPPIRRHAGTRRRETLVFGHRGFGDHAPDNSLYAVERAIDAGVDGVDVDGQFTRDSELVIFHDLSVDRLTAGHRPGAAARPWRRCWRSTWGPSTDSAMTGAMVQTFEDFVRTVTGRGGILMVELKVPGSGAPASRNARSRSSGSTTPRPAWCSARSTRSCSGA